MMMMTVLKSSTNGSGDGYEVTVPKVVGVIVV